MPSRGECIGHNQFTPKDIERLEARVAALKEAHEFDDDNHAYVEAATQIASEASDQKDNILSALEKEDKNKKPPPPPEPAAPPVPQKSRHDNAPDLIDAIVAERKLPPAVGQAYLEATVMGRSHAAIAKDLGVGKSTVGDWVRTFDPLYQEESRTRLLRDAEKRTEQQPAEEPGRETAVEPVAEESKPKLAAEDAPLKIASDEELAEEKAASEADRNDGNLNIVGERQKNGRGKVSADNNIDEAHDKRLGKQWEQLSARMPEEQRVAWKDLGSAQKDTFAFESEKGEGNAARAHREITKSANEGMKFGLEGKAEPDAWKLGNTEPQAEDMAHALTLPAVLQGRRMDGKVEKSGSREVTFHGLNADHGPTLRALAELAKDPVAGGFISRALASTRAIVTFTSSTIKASGFFHPGMRLLGINERTRALAQWAANEPFNPGVQRQHHVLIVHELTHSADYTAQQDVGMRGAGYQFASETQGSKTFAQLNILDDGTIVRDFSPLVSAVYDAMRTIDMSSPVQKMMYDHIRYAFDPLVQVQYELRQLAPEARLDWLKANGERVMDAENHLALELNSVLTPLATIYPEALREHIPLAYEHAMKIINARDSLELYRALTDEEPSVQHSAEADQGDATETRIAAGDEHAPEGEPGRAAPVRPDAGADERSEGVPGEVRSGAAAALPGGEPSGVQPGAETRGVKREAGRDAEAARAGEGSGGGLTLPPISEPGKLEGWYKRIVGDKFYRNHPWVLATLSTEQLAERFKEHPLVQAFSDATQKMGGLSNKILGDAHPVIGRWSKAAREEGKMASDAFSQLLIDSTRSGWWPNKAFDDTAHDFKKPGAPDAQTASPQELANYNADMTRLQAEHAALASRWNKTPESLRELFPKLEQINRENWQRHVDADRQLIVKSYFPTLSEEGKLSKDDLLKAADLTTQAERDALTKGMDPVDTKRLTDMWESLDDHKADYREGLRGPYFPLTRFGEHVVSYKSPEFRAAETALAEAKKGKDKDAIQKAQENLNSFKADNSHYNVEFFENRAEAKTREAQLNAFFNGDGTEVSRTMRDQFLTKQDRTQPAYVNRIADHLVEALPSAQADEIRKTVREMYIQNLPGQHALKSTLKRRNVPGVKASEMQTAYATKVTKDAHAISRKLYMPDLHEHQKSLREGSDEDGQILGNELAKRMALNASTKTNGLINFATNATYFSQLGLSPGFMLMQGTQQWINTAPMMAARHGVGKTTTELARGTKIAGQMLKTSFTNGGSRMSFKLDLAAAETKGLVSTDERAMLQDMIDRGRIDVASVHDAGLTAQGRDQSTLGRAVTMANWPVQQLEVINRISTALAGYRAEMEKATKEGVEPHKARYQSERYAERLVSETHMNYSVENRARFIHPNTWGGWGRVMFQFRAYQQGMAYLTVKNIIDGLRGDKEALKAGGYMAGMQLGVAGVAGLPVPGAMAAAAHFLYQSFNDDDEDRDLKEMFYQGLKSAGGETFADAVTKGVPAALGVDLSEKLGAGHVFDVAPFVRPQKDGRDLTAAYFMSMVGGAAGGNVANYAEALHQAGQGEFAKSLEMILPKFMADPMKAGDMALRGTRDTRGNQILTPDDLNAAEIALKAFGFQPTTLARTADERAAFFTARTSRNDARAKLVETYARNAIAGEDNSDIHQKIQEFNERHPDDRIPPGSLPVAVQKLRERERTMRGGVPVGKRDKALADEVLGEE